MSQNLMSEAAILSLLRRAIKMLSDRFLTFSVFMAVCFAGAYTLVDPNLHKDAIVVFFGILYVVTLSKERAAVLPTINAEGIHNDD